MAAIPLTQEVFYPESDGKPMGETDVHVTELLDLLAALRQRYRDAADVFVGGDMFLYYVEGNPARCVCPDVFVTFGIPKTPKKRRSYFLWRDGQGLRLIDAKTRRPLPRIEELGQMAEEQSRIIQEKDRALREAQEEIARLRGQSEG